MLPDAGRGTLSWPSGSSAPSSERRAPARYAERDRRRKRSVEPETRRTVSRSPWPRPLALAAGTLGGAGVRMPAVSGRVPSRSRRVAAAAWFVPVGGPRARGARRTLPRTRGSRSSNHLARAPSAVAGLPSLAGRNRHLRRRSSRVDDDVRLRRHVGRPCRLRDRKLGGPIAEVGSASLLDEERQLRVADGRTAAREPTFERALQFECRRVPLARLGRHGAENDPFECGRIAAEDLARRSGFARDERSHDLGSCSPWNGRCPVVAS